MSGKRSLTNLHLSSLLKVKNLDDLAKQLEPDKTTPLCCYLPNAKINDTRAQRMWRSIGQPSHPDIYDDWTKENIESFHGNIENCIGSVKVPMGIAGPLRVNGLFAKGDYPIPLATSEAALVAS